MKGPLVGYRAWQLNIHQDQLLPAVMYGAPPWNSKGATEAKCYRRSTMLGSSFIHLGTSSVHGELTPPDHLSPSLDCTCGLYAYPVVPRQWLEIGEYTPYLIGAVLAKGRIVPHANGHVLEGFRAQYARPIAFIQPAHNDLPVYRSVVRIAKRHGAMITESPETLIACTRDWPTLQQLTGWEPKYSWPPFEPVIV